MRLRLGLLCDHGCLLDDRCPDRLRRLLLGNGRRFLGLPGVRLRLDRLGRLLDGRRLDGLRHLRLDGDRRYTGLRGIRLRRVRLRCVRLRRVRLRLGRLRGLELRRDRRPHCLRVPELGGRGLLRQGVGRVLGLVESLGVLDVLGRCRLGHGHGELCLLRNDRFCGRSPGRHRGGGLRGGADPLRHGLLGRVEVLRAGVAYGARRHGGTGRPAVGEGADRAGGGVGGRRTEVQRAAGHRRLRDGGRDGGTDGAQVVRAAVAAGHLVRARLMDGGLVDDLDDGLGGGRGHLVAPRALGARQQEIFVLGGGLGEVGVRTRRRDARLLHHACALRQSLARDLAGVGHAYPSPIG
nr:hypothetical protein [Streptomyces sp. LBUM 1477]